MKKRKKERRKRKSKGRKKRSQERKDSGYFRVGILSG